MEAERFRVYRRAYVDGAWTDWEIVSSKATGTGCTDMKAVSGVTCEYRVRAYAGGVWGAMSDTASGTAK